MTATMNQTAELNQTLQNAHRRLRRTARQLLRCCSATLEDDLADVQYLLQCLPLATDEFVTANRRIENAIRYALTGEFGAARYELAMLDNSLLRNAVT